MRASIFRVQAFVTLAAAMELANPFYEWAHVNESQVPDLSIDLGYEVYVGQSENDLMSWEGVRYAAAPTGNYRWQAPRVPEVNRSSSISAAELGERCVQNSGEDTIGSEDCLFLNVYAPPDAIDLPVLVFIHGGGYHGGGPSDPSSLILGSEHPFVAVTIQYRLGAFGFLSSEEVQQSGKLNAGLLDMQLALQWIQAYIPLFGGDSSAVTISGESAGAGAVMLLSLLYDGELGDSLFSSVIASSPFLPKQFDYADSVPEDNYRSLAGYAGCGDASADLFACLLEKDMTIISDAGKKVLSAANLLTWGFMPVTDGVLLKNAPSKQLQQKKVNGGKILVGNMANEGPGFTPQNITTDADFTDYIQNYFPDFSEDDISSVLDMYPSSEDTNPSATNYSTLGYTGPSALEMSGFANGQQQRANNLQAEITFICPAYWLSNAFSEAWKYEFSVPPAQHGFDVGSYFISGSEHPDFSDDFVAAFQNIWGNFITQGDPRISQELACGSSCSSNETQIQDWQPFNQDNPTQLTVNVTGGTPGFYDYLGLQIPQNTDPGLQNKFTVSDAYKWEEGRGHRCDFWQSNAGKVPE